MLRLDRDVSAVVTMLLALGRLRRLLDRRDICEIEEVLRLHSLVFFLLNVYYICLVVDSNI